MNDKQIGKAIEAALSDNDKQVRVAALDLIGKTAMPKAQMVTLLTEVMQNRSKEEKQAALLTLGKLPVANTQAVFDQLLTDLSAGKIPVDIVWNWKNHCRNPLAPNDAKHKAILAKQSPDAVLASYQASLFGGEPDRGRRVFFRHQTAQCIRCHSYDDLGGNAGPRLNGVANRLTREQLLEAVINPSAAAGPRFWHGNP